MPVLLIADAELSGEAHVEMADSMTRLIRGQGLYLPTWGPYDESTGMFWLVKLVVR